LHRKFLSKVCFIMTVDVDGGGTFGGGRSEIKQLDLLWR
jgi:hypothetical protein